MKCIEQENSRSVQQTSQAAVHFSSNRRRERRDHGILQTINYMYGFSTNELEVSDVPAANVSLPGSTPSTLADIEAALTNLKAMKGQLKKSKKELLKLIKEDYPKDLKDIALLL